MKCLIVNKSYLSIQTLSPISNSAKIRPAGVETMHVGRYDEAKNLGF